MNSELKQAAQRALLALRNSQPRPSNPFIGLTKQDFIDHEETIRQLRNALQQPAPAVQAEVTDEQIKEAATKAVKERNLSWVWFEKDDQDKYTIPTLSKSHYQLVRAGLSLRPEGVQMPDATLSERARIVDLIEGRACKHNGPHLLTLELNQLADVIKSGLGWAEYERQSSTAD